MADPRSSGPNGDTGDTGDATGAGPGRGSTTRTPRWLSVFGIIALVLILLFGVWLFAAGGRSPARHTSSGAASATLSRSESLDTSPEAGARSIRSEGSS